MSGRKRTHDEVDSSSAAAPTFASFFEYLAPELRSYVAAYCGPFMLPALVAAGIVEFSEMDAGKRRIAYDATLVDSMRVWASRSCCFDFQDILHAFIGRYYGMIDDATRSAMCALFIEAVEGAATEIKHISLESTVIDALDSDDGATMRVLAPLKSIRSMLIGKSKTSLLGYAAKRNSVECARVLIANGADIDDRASENHPALYKAVLKKNTQFVDLLLAAGADPNIRARHNFTPLYTASYTDEYYDIARLLIQYGADVNAACRDGSALTNAITCRAQRIARLLLVHNADIHAHHSTFVGAPPIVSPLMESVRANLTDITRLLLQLGASPYDLSSLGKPVDDLIANMCEPSIRYDGFGTLDPEHATLIREACALYVP